MTDIEMRTTDGRDRLFTLATCRIVVISAPWILDRTRKKLGFIVRKHVAIQTSHARSVDVRNSVIHVKQHVGRPPKEG